VPTDAKVVVAAPGAVESFPEGTGEPLLQGAELLPTRPPEPVPVE